MIESGSGPKTIELEQPSIVIEQLFYIMDDGEANFDALSTDDHGIEYAVQVARFLDCYDCPLAFKLYIRGLCFTSAPPIILFMTGALLRRPELCVQGFDKGDTKSKSILYSKSWKAPQDLSLSAKSWNMFCPLAIPRSLFVQIPPDYMWALVQLQIDPKSRSMDSLGDPVGEFLSLLRVPAKPARKRQRIAK